MVTVEKFESNIATVSLDTNNYITKNSSCEFQGLTCGSLVRCKISSMLETGLKVKFLGIFEASVPFTHLQDRETLELENSSYKVGGKLDCRILYIDHKTKSVHLSNLEHIVKAETFEVEEGFEHGQIRQDLIVLKIDPKFGLWVKCGNVLGFVHISKVSDKHVDNLNKFKLDSLQKGRIVGHDLCDQIILFSLQKSVIESPFLHIEDLTVGAILTGSIVKLESFGAIVKVADGINGLCPTLYLSDAKLSKPEKLFKVGAKMQFRVLSMDSEQNRLILSHKKSLLGLESIITNYDDLKPGMVNTGVITTIKNYGCIVTFFNNVRALVPIAEMRHARAISIDQYWPGLAVKCQILTVDPENEKLRASFLIKEHVSNAEEMVGSVFNCILEKVEDKGLIVKLEGLEGKCLVVEEQLSDSSTLSASILAKFKSSNIAGCNLGKCLLLSYNSKKGIYNATTKPMLVAAAEQSDLFRNSNDLQVDMLVPAVVKAINGRICFVTIGLVDAVVAIHNIIDGFISNISDILNVGQTVLARVIAIEEGKVSVSLKHSHVKTLQGFSNFETQYLDSLFRSKAMAASIVGKKASCLKTHSVGKVVTGKIVHPMPFGASVELTSKLTGLLVDKTRTYIEGETCQVMIMDVDVMTNIADLTVSKISELTTTIKPESDLNAVYEGIVVLVKGDYVAILTEASSCGPICYAVCKSFSSSSHSSRFKTGQTIKFKIGKSGEYEAGLFRTLVNPIESAEVVVKKMSKRVITNSEDVSLNTLDDVTVGKIIKCKIQAIKGTQLNIRIADNLRGRIHISEIYELFDDIEDKQKPLGKFLIGQHLEAKVIGFHHAKTHSYLPLTHNSSNAAVVVELTLRNNLSSGEDLKRLTNSELIVGEKYLGFVHRVETSSLWIQLSPWTLGRVEALHASNEAKVCADLKKNFIEGQAIQAFVISKNDTLEQLDLSLTESNNDIAVGDEVMGKITNIDKAKGLTMYLSRGKYGRIHLTELSEEFELEPLKGYDVGTIIKAVVSAIADGKIDLTLRTSRPNLLKGALVQGYITSITDKGCYVELSNVSNGRVKISEVSDDYVKEWKSTLQIGQLVKVKILSIDTERNQVELTLKKSALDPNCKRITIEDLEAETIVSGEVKKIEKFGMFILIDNSPIRGLCHISEVSESSVSDISKLYEIGDRVQAFIIKVDFKKQRVSLSLKASHFEPEPECDSVQDIEMLEEEEKTEVVNHPSKADESADDSLVDDETPIVVAEEPLLQIENSQVTEFKALGFEDSFSWNGEQKNISIDTSSESSDSDATEVVQPKKLSRKEKIEKLEQKNLKIEEQEKRLLDYDAVPESVDDFERLVLTSPNDSSIWIKYMAYHLELAEVGIARSVVDRALSTINFREEQERLNLCIALMNLENKFGTPDSLKAAFSRCCGVCEPKDIHIQYFKMLTREEKFEVFQINYKDADEIIAKMIKKYRESTTIWTLFMEYKLSKGKYVEAREILNRNLIGLPQSICIQI